MRIVLSLSLATFIPFAVSGCFKSPYKKNADAADKMIEIHEEYAEALESVKDRESAKAAAAKIVSINKRMKEHRKILNDLPKVSESDRDKLDKEYLPKFKAIKTRLRTAIIQAARKSGGAPSLVKALQEMDQVNQKMN